MKNFLKSLKRTAIAALLGFALWNLSTPAYAASANDYKTNERGSIQNTELYDQIQSEKDGMNTFNDTDPRRNTKRVDAKAQTLKDTAKRRSAQASDPLEPAREALDTLKSEVGNAVDDVVGR